MTESKLRELSTDLYNRCGTIRRILVASINTAKENYKRKRLIQNQNPIFPYNSITRLTPNLITGNIRL
nr:hypothetical protein [Ruminococcus bromii]